MASATPSPANQAPEFDLLLPLRSAGNLENPYPIYALLRTVHPVLEVPVPDWDGPGVCMLTRHRDVDAVLKDLRFSVDRTQAPLIRDNLDRMPTFIRQSTQGLRSMLITDPPDHTRLRKLANKAFTPKRVAGLRGRIEELVRSELDVAQERGEMDLVGDLAESLPAIVIAELLGVPAADRQQFKQWSSQLIAALGAASFEDRRRLGGSASEELLAYLQAVIAERRASPRDDLISALIAAQEERDALTDLELLATCNLILIAGHETTTNLIGNGMLALLREPRQLARLRADPTLIGTAIEELLRYDGPVQATLRVAREDVQIDDHVIPEGALVIVNLGAANRDPEVFDHPEELDITRDPNPHLAFGFGAHFCMGAPLARLEGQLAIGELVRRFKTIELVDEAPAYRENPILRGLKRLDLKVTA